MTPKEYKKKHPGYQVKISKSKSNKYTLAWVFDTKEPSQPGSDLDKYEDVYLYVNEKLLGHWDNVIKPSGNPIIIMYNKNQPSFEWISFNITSKVSAPGRTFDGIRRTVDYQIDYNRLTEHFFSLYVGEFTKGMNSKSPKWRNMYDLLKKEMYPLPYNSCAQYAIISPTMGWSYRKTGLYHYKHGLMIPTGSKYSASRTNRCVSITIVDYDETVLIKDKEINNGGDMETLINRARVYNIFEQEQ